MYSSNIIHVSIAVLLLASTSQAQICPGYDYGFLPNDGDIHGGSPWDIVDGSCMINGNCYSDYPCDCTNIDCARENTTSTANSAPSEHVQAVQVEGLWYTCTPIVNAGSCRNHTVQSCCRKDGKRNLGEGLINESQYAAIEEAHKMLDEQTREIEIAVTTGLSESETETLAKVHGRDLQEAVTKEDEVGVEATIENCRSC